MNNVDVNMRVKANFHQGSLLQSKKTVSGEISKEPFLDILLTDFEQSSFSFIFQDQGAPRREVTLTPLKTSSYLFTNSTLPDRTQQPRAVVNQRFVQKVSQRESGGKLCLNTPSNRGSLQTNRQISCLLKVGDYVHCGDKIGYLSETPIVMSESGKILQISQTQITIQKVQPVLFVSQAEIHVESNEWVKRGTPILTLTHQTLVTGDIVQGIPRIEQLFEASTATPPGAVLQDFGSPSDDDSLKKSSIDDYLKSHHTSHFLPLTSSFINAQDGGGSKHNSERILQNKKSIDQINWDSGEKKYAREANSKTKLGVSKLRFNAKTSLCKNSVVQKRTFLHALHSKLKQNEVLLRNPLSYSTVDSTTEEKPVFLYKTLQSQVRETFRKKWDQFPLPVAVRQSLEEIQQVIVESIQKVYISQGVLIADKHIEIIVRQMTSKAQVFDGGSTGLLIDEILSLQQIENANISTPGKKALYLPVIMGLTRAALSSDSFVSAASFQETTRVLSRDAIAGKTDFLRGLKEKVIIGDLIDAGTGLDAFYIYSLFSKKLFENKFREILNRKVTHKTLKKLVLTVSRP